LLAKGPVHPTHFIADRSPSRARWSATPVVPTESHTLVSARAMREGSNLHITLHFIKQVLNGVQTVFGVVDFQQGDFVLLGKRQQVGKLVGQ